MAWSYPPENLYPLSAAEAEADQMSGGNLLWEPAFPTAPSCQLPFLKGREVISKLSLFFSKIRIGL